MLIREGLSHGAAGDRETSRLSRFCPQESDQDVEGGYFQYTPRKNGCDVEFDHSKVRAGRLSGDLRSTITVRCLGYDGEQASDLICPSELLLRC